MAERETIKTTGVCLGASSVGLVAVEWVPGPGADVSSNIVFSVARPHNGKVLQTIQALYGDGAPGTVHLAAVTGRRFRHALALPSISEPEAVEWAYGCVKEKYAPVDLIMAAGGETFMAYKLDGAGRVVSVYTGNKCASGSGEFFLQQIRRMGLSAEEALSFADLESPHLVAGRCSVFCKTDCTHALNKGAPKASVVSGLCAMMAGKIIDLIQKTRLADSRRVLLVGGAAANEAMLHFVRREFPQLQVAEEAPYFEALGAALWARDFGAPAPLSWEEAKLPARSAFTALPPLRQYAVQAASRNLFRGTGKAGDRCIIGLDVGSTTTKAVVLRMADNAVLAGTYLRTNGDPVGASRACYRALSDQLKTPVKIRGLGVTGSGRQIAGLHAGTDAVVNEIIAHARAAVHFDPEVDTIFEIGGQDAKYTYLTNGVASDYAMNEACSAGTGSFLEEAARESLDIDTHDIAGLAVLGRRPPNFNDQCAAFIASDIKQAIQEGIGREDICAGLVYSVCQNYNNRVKGARPVGRKVFMQGGVCYNHAVPLAMAALTGKDIIVPPEPGLMGAFGVALAVKDKLASGRLAEKDFDLSALADRVLSYGKPFTCTGGKENCDRKCEISRISIGDRLFPFGGACNRYVNLLHRTKVDTAALDLTAVRERLVFGDGAPVRSDGLRVGITASLLDHVLFPLFSTFFRELGFRVVLPDGPDTQGMERMGSAFCHPVEVAHGLLAALLKKKPDVIFLPHVMGMAVEKGIGNEVTCPLVQGEPYYLKSAFGELKNRRILSPMLNLSTGFEAAESSFVRLARSLGVSAKAGRLAFAAALETQRSVQSEMKDRGGKALEALAMDPQQFAVVLFGRPYNAFSKWANMGIPHKFASRGLPAIPFDFLPLEDEAPFGHMFWALGQINLKATRLVERHPQLFPVFITNFSCGPDSFILTYFRNLMGRKPSLTLELDSHTADAGVDTRIEAFLDVVASYIETERTAPPRSCNPARKVFAKVEKNGGMPLVRASNGTRLPLSHPNVRL
ncbi:MAG: acyl-CoA dehydratase activase, partial [Acidobacteriota bacterium]